MDAYRIVNRCNEHTDVCSKDSDASSNRADHSLDDSTYGSMNGYTDESPKNQVCNDLNHLGKTATDSHSGQTCDPRHHHADSAEQNPKDGAVGNSENSRHSSLSTAVNDHPSVKLKPSSQEATAVNRKSSLESTNCLESRGDCSEVEERPVICEPNTNIDYSCLELVTIPGSLYLMPATTELCLDYNDFTELPDALFERLSSLRALSLVANSLTCLPENISRLSRLEELNVAQNSLCALPPSIGSLPQLHSIDFSQNQITALPADFGRLSNLEKIVGFGNLLTCLPQTFGRLENLISVDLSGNQLKVLSHSFGFLVRLKSLNLSSNGLDHLPESVTCLSTLEHLNVSDNMLTCLPDKLQCLQKLKQLYVANNQLKLLPAWIENLPALEELRLEKNLLTGSPLSDTLASSCRRLRVLNLSRNLIRNITNSIVGLENLEWLDLGSGEDEHSESMMTCSNTCSKVYNWIWQLPPHFDMLQRLRHLNLYAIHLEELPDDFGYLINLEWLNLGANELRDLPQSFGQLTSLKYLVLSMNQLELLPSNFGSLAKLEELRLDRNRLAELPQSFCCLARLRHLDLFSNSLTELPLFLQSFVQLKFVNLDENSFKGNSLQLRINGKQIMVVQRRANPTSQCCAQTDWLENVESLSRDSSPVGEICTSDETNEKNLEGEGQEKEDSSCRPGSSSSCSSQAKVSWVKREKEHEEEEEEEEEEEDWDKELLENNPFVDIELPGDSSETKLCPSSCSTDCVPFVSFVPSTWHAPRVNTHHSNIRRSPFPFSPFSYQTLNSDQFEDADEESG